MIYYVLISWKSSKRCEWYLPWVNIFCTQHAPRLHIYRIGAMSYADQAALDEIGGNEVWNIGDNCAKCI